MWRARTDGDDRPSNGAGAQPDTGSRPGQERSSTDWPTDGPSDDPRSELTGRKIRRIESGPPGAERARAGAQPQRALARRRPAGPDDATRAVAASLANDTARANDTIRADDTVVASRPGQARTGRPARRPAPDGSGRGVDAGGGLPPLRQPTGEVPAVPTSSETIEAGPAGVFGTGGDTVKAGDRSTEPTAPSALSATGSGRTAARAGRPAESWASPAAEPTSGRAMPSAFPEKDDPSAQSAFPSWTASGASGVGRSETTAAMGAMAGRPERAGTLSRPEGRPSPDPTGHGPTGGGRTGAAAQRLQETEIKLGGRQEPVKPKEPNRLLLLGAVAVVILAGAAVAWWLTRDGGATESAEPDAEVAQTETTDPATADAEATASSVAPTTPADPILDVPTLSLVGVEPGPLDPAGTYSIDIYGEAPDSLFQVVVDDVPQGAPAAVLPDLILPTGRHTLMVNVTNGAEVKASTLVEVYVRGAPPAEAGPIANLASVDIVNEGWDEAIRRFDGFRADGHEGLQLLSITPGYWNIFVAGLGDTETVEAYCESFGLAFPVDCFPKPFDPAEYQAPVAPAPATDAGTGTEGDDAEMTDGSGPDTSTSTTAGG